MARSIPGETRERILKEAIGLFSAKGYQATSVADIQVACGLTPGSGALYKHFPSKKALLDAVIDRHIESMAAERQAFEDHLPDDLRQLLRYGAEVVWRAMERDRQIVRITVRDVEPYPELRDRLWDGVLANVYREFEAVLQMEKGRGRVDVADPAATAAVLVASLTYFPIIHSVIGRTPGDIDADRFLDAWVDHAARSVIRPDQIG